jgi:glutamine synthetase
MREEGGKELFDEILRVLKSNHQKHIEVYGSDNDKRLTGKHETQSIDKFSWGVSDRGASIRIPQSTVKNGWRGYLEDRRPASNACPYKIVKQLTESLKQAQQNILTLQ